MKFCAIVSMAVVSCFPAAAASRFDLGSLGKLARVTDPQISPDGKSVVVVVARPNYEDNRFDAELVLVGLAGGQQRVLTRDRLAVSAPR